jgi:hypothetical protein
MRWFGRIKRRSSFADHLKSKHGINADVVDIDAFAPPLLPALTKERKPRGRALKLITDGTIADEFKDQPFESTGGMYRSIDVDYIPQSIYLGLSSACSDTPSPVDVLPRNSNMSGDLQVPLYSDVIDDFFEAKPFGSLDLPIDFQTPERCFQHPICPPLPPPLPAVVRFDPLQTSSFGHSFNAPHHPHTIATRDVAFDVNSVPFGLRGRIDLSDYSFPGSVKSWS